MNDLRQRFQNRMNRAVLELEVPAKKLAALLFFRATEIQRTFPRIAGLLKHPVDGSGFPAKLVAQDMGCTVRNDHQVSGRKIDGRSIALNLEPTGSTHGHVEPGNIAERRYLHCPGR